MNLQEKRILVPKIGDSEKSGLKLQRLIEEEKRLLVRLALACDECGIMAQNVAQINS